MIARSYLYVPATNLEMLSKATSRGADAIIVDLEDSVSARDKSQARGNLRIWLEGLSTETQIWVRLNDDSIDLDLAALDSQKVFGLVIPKATVANLTYISERVAGRYQLSALIESAGSLLNALKIASVAGVSFLQIGQLDLRVELGLSDDDDLDTLKYALAHIVLASAAAGINQPIAPIYRDFNDEQGLSNSCQELKRNGFFGRTCIHPKQVATVNSEFTTSAQEFSEAKDILKALSTGQGVGTDPQGRMIDLASARLAQRIIDRTRAD